MCTFQDEQKAAKMRQSNSNEWLLSALSQVEQEVTSTTPTNNGLLAVSPGGVATEASPANASNFYIETSSEDEKTTYNASQQPSLQKHVVHMQSGLHTNVPNVGNNDIDPCQRSRPDVQLGKGDATFQQLNQRVASPLKPEIKITANQGELFSTEVSSPDVMPNRLSSKAGDPAAKINRNISLFNLDMRDKGDYIFQAAKQISLAQQCEASANHRMAFNYYRNGVGMLLTGVQRKPQPPVSRRARHTLYL